ncbi:MAG TPA: Stp1/IreP family PP2C-type Ser/Thr phosphatase [Polyangiaceae bacterium]|nr:Stp1/IreP family PP2C-type Ser/Thr phosphatase [Polyangiaceae bacterium]
MAADGEALRFWPVTDVGRVRDHNEDNFLVSKKLQLFVVCDGMGGHAAGEVASSIAAKTVKEVIAAQTEMLTQFEQGIGNVGRTDILRLMEQAVQQACNAVYQEGQRDETKRGMGTTLDALLILGDRGFIGHVGDSRVYLYRQGSVHQLTEDHSLINELLRRGRLSREQIDSLQQKNAVTRAVGVYESVEVDTIDFDVLRGDRFLLCTDGLHGYFEQAELGKLFGETPEDQLSQKLIDLSNERGGKDNITAIVVKVPDAESGVDRLAREVNLKMEVLHKMPLFRHLTYQELVRVMNLTKVRQYGTDDEVVAEGAEGDELFIVLTGRVRVESAKTKIAELGPGEHFGEMALVDKAPRSADIIASEPSSLLSIKRRDFFDIIRKDHPIAVKLLWSFLGVLTERLRNTSRELGAARDNKSPTTSLAPMSEAASLLDALVSSGDDSER